MIRSPFRTATLVLSLGLMAFLPSCKGSSDSAAPSSASPSLPSFAPRSGAVGDAVILTGTDLGTTLGVIFPPDLAAPFSVDSDARVTVMVPPGAATGPIRILRESGPSTLAGTFTVTGVPPGVTSFAPIQGTAASRVALTGSGFTGVTEIRFGGVLAPQFQILSDGALQVTVPEAAVTGPITLASPAGNATSAQVFTVVAGAPLPPEIRDISPVTGPVGIPVRLAGTGLFTVTTVRFGGVAAGFVVLDDGEILTEVPAGAASGPVTVTTQAGATVASAPFTVTQVAPGGPTITGIQPLAGSPGDLVTILGTDLAGVVSASLGGRPAVVSLASATRVVIFVPAQDPVSGPLVLNFPGGGQATFPSPFTVTFPPPGITAFHPASGPAGTCVTLTGSGLDSPTAVFFGAVAAPALVRSSAAEIQVLVPAGAVSGPITVRTRGGESRTDQPFQIRGGHSALDIAIAGLYVTQATQRLDRSVPLIAGRGGQARVFLRANMPNDRSPGVRLTLTDPAGNVLLTQDIPAPRAGVPTVLDEAGPSWDLPLPGALLQPGTAIQARILSGDGDLDAGDDGFPVGGGVLNLDIHAVAPLGLTLIPVNQGGQVGLVTSDARSLDSWTADLKVLFPLKDIDVQVGEVFNFDGVVDDAHPEAFDELLDQLELARVAAAPDNPRYYYGVCALAADTVVKGNGFTSADPAARLFRTAAGFDGTQGNGFDTYGLIMTHELGHTLGRSHAPCGVFTLVDANFPYPHGRIGVAGFNPATSENLDPEVTTDIMGYCQPKWVSDYTFRGIMAAREGAGMEAAPAATPAEGGPGLLVWGSIRDGGVTLEPALEVKAGAAPVPAGPFTLTLRDAAGAVLLEQPFGAAALEDSRGSTDRRSFFLVLPLTAEIRAALATLDVAGPGGSASTRTASLSLPARGVALPRDPVATAWRPGTVHLGWDAGTHPLVLVRNAASGQVIGVARGGSADLVTDATELDLTLSAGARSVGFRARVQP